MFLKEKKMYGNNFKYDDFATDFTFPMAKYKCRDKVQRKIKV